MQMCMLFHIWEFNLFANSASMDVLFSPQENGFHRQKVSKGDICMNLLFSRKKEKYFNLLTAEIFTQPVNF